MKICNICKIEKDESEFGIDNSIKCGLKGMCKSCQKISRSKWVKKLKFVNCQYCGKEFSTNGSDYGKYCNPECQGKHNSQLHYDRYKLDNSIAYGQSNMGSYKKHFLEEQNHKCVICGIPDI